MTKYYVDSGGVYLGAFVGDTGIVPAGAVEVPYPPDSAAQIWNGVIWVG